VLHKDKWAMKNVTDRRREANAVMKRILSCTNVLTIVQAPVFFAGSYRKQ